MESLSICKMEQWIDVEMFLDEYLHWEVGGCITP